MKFEEFFSLITQQKYDFNSVLNEVINEANEEAATENLKKYLKIVWACGWNSGKGSKTTDEVLKSLTEEIRHIKDQKH